MFYCFLFILTSLLFSNSCSGLPSIESDSIYVGEEVVSSDD